MNEVPDYRDGGKQHGQVWSDLGGIGCCPRVRSVALSQHHAWPE